MTDHPEVEVRVAVVAKTPARVARGKRASCRHAGGGGGCQGRAGGRAGGERGARARCGTCRGRAWGGGGRGGGAIGVLPRSPSRSLRYSSGNVTWNGWRDGRRDGRVTFVTRA